MKLLTEPEAAQILQCSTSKIKRLRFAGKLAYVPGRPVLIDEKDLAAYIDEKKREREQRDSERRAARAPMDAKKWAQIAVLLTPDRRKPKAL
ncbi:DNA-binding protein [Rhizobium rhizosphaerae]|uniref:DNA-binding protein n=1 Tax=Xaviernesmea rhizosphaerae TaxID=1672749 RepID=A0ABX3PA13_9HYPH|nr:helix-turn-helix domain-containing protein [Xaviernesmea rhizosphaerae]OQP84615.1 DNA-binding protein [Xaviernesmea rhizosphaerae]